MKPELSERLFVENLFQASLQRNKIESLSNIDVEILTGDASTRRYYRISNNKKSYVVCLANPLDEAIDSSPFMEVQTLLKAEGVRVPEIYDYDLTKGYFLEEDLGDHTFLNYISVCRDAQEEFTNYKRLIDILGKIHLISRDAIAGKKCGELAFDFDKFYFEIEFSHKYFFDMYLERKISKEDQITLETGFTRICKILSDQPRVLTHRDFHSRNIMTKENEFIVIDFQDARMGIPQYDLVSILEDAYFQIRPEVKKDLKEYYLQKYFSSLSSTDEARKNFDTHYNYMTIQRLYKAIGSFCYIYNTRSDKRYLKYIGYCFEKLRLTLSKCDELSDLNRVLSKNYYGN